MNIETTEYEEIWDENIQLRNEIASVQITLLDAFDAMNIICDLTHKCLDHPNAHEHPVWRKGLLQCLARTQQNIANALQVEESK
jgi:hypothetical protein